jgi:hypothetical protein
MIESVIMLLIYVCVVALVIYLILWVVQSVLGVQLPGKVIQILWVIFALIVILLLARLVLSSGGIGKLKLSSMYAAAMLPSLPLRLR